MITDRASEATTSRHTRFISLITRLCQVPKVRQPSKLDHLQPHFDMPDTTSRCPVLPSFPLWQRQVLCVHVFMHIDFY